MESRKIVYRETGAIVIGMIPCVGIMLGIYALLGRMDSAVLLSGVLGAVLAVANFFFMAVGTSLAADKAQAQDVKGGQALLQISQIVRYVALIVILFALIKSGLCKVLPLMLPLIFVRPILTFGEFFRKSGDKAK